MIQANKYNETATEAYRNSDVYRMRELAAKVDAIAGMQMTAQTNAYIKSLEREIEYSIMCMGITEAYSDFFVSLLKCREYRAQLPSAIRV